MKNQVTITANKEGQVFVSTGISAKDGKEYGYVRLESKWLDMSGPIAQVRSLSALKTFSREAFDMSELKAGDALDGKIVIKESTIKNPFRANQQPKIQPKNPNVAGDVDKLLLFNGAPIYRETEFTTDMSAENVLVKHTSVQPIQQTADVKLNS